MTKENKPLDEAARVTAVMNAAGRSARMATHLPDKYRKQLADLHGQTAIPDKVASILRQCGEDNKANIDEA